MLSASIERGKTFEFKNHFHSSNTFLILSNNLTNERLGGLRFTKGVWIFSPHKLIITPYPP